MRPGRGVPIWHAAMGYALDIHPTLRPLFEALPPATLVTALQELASYAAACDTLPVGAQQLARPPRFQLLVEGWRLTVSIDHALAALRVVALERVTEEGSAAA